MADSRHDLILRPATLDDAEAMRSMYNHEVEHETTTFDLVPRSLDAQREWIARRSGAFCAIVAASATDGIGNGIEPGNRSAHWWVGYLSTQLESFLAATDPEAAA